MRTTTTGGSFDRVEGRELLGERGVVVVVGGLLAYDARDREGKRKRKRRERVVCRFSVTVLYIFPCRSAVLFFLVLLFLSRPSLFLSFFSLDPPLSGSRSLTTSLPLYLRGPVSVRVTPGWVEAEVEEETERDGYAARPITMCKYSQEKARAE